MCIAFNNHFFLARCLILIGEVKDIKLIPLVLLASFYVFNICYPEGLGCFYSMLEVLILNIPLSKATPSVQHIYTSINNVD